MSVPWHKRTTHLCQPRPRVFPCLWCSSDSHHGPWERGRSYQPSPGQQPQSLRVAAPHAQRDKGCQTPRYRATLEGQLFSLFIAVWKLIVRISCQRPCYLRSPRLIPVIFPIPRANYNSLPVLPSPSSLLPQTSYRDVKLLIAHLCFFISFLRIPKPLERDRLCLV